MRGYWIGVAACASLAGCGGEVAQENKESTARVETITPGEYELSTTVAALRSTDESAPATDLKIGGDAMVKRACIAADGTIAPAMFAEGSDECSPTDTYVRNGRMSMQLRCSRAGKGGHVMQLVDGDFTADGFEAKVLGSTSFSGPGDYEITRNVVGKRVGECPSEGAAS